MTKKEILESVVSQKFPYRKTINIPKNIGFGYEIEMGLGLIDHAKIYNDFSKSKYEVAPESNMYNKTHILGTEIVTPVFYNNEKSWKELKKLSDKLKTYKANFDYYSFQVNVDDNNGIYQNPLKFIKFFTAYEDIIYTISKGYDKDLRKGIDIYAHSCLHGLNNIDLNDPKSIYMLNLQFYRNKFYALSLKNKIIEFRTPNSTFDAWLWQNYANIFTNLLLSIQDDKIDYDKIDKYLKNPIDRNVLNIDKAIELSNIIFSSDTDKLYLLKQYLYGISNNQILSLIA